MLEVGGVVDTRCEHHDGRVFDASRGGCPERTEQFVRIIAHGAHPHTDEQFGQSLGHDPAVGDHVADAGRHPHIVFEHAPGALFVADQVDAADLDAHAIRGVDAGGLAVEVARRRDEPGGDHAILDRVLLTVDVGQEGFERSHPLLDPGLDGQPLRLVDDAGHGIEGKRSFLTGEVERDALGEVARPEGFGATAELILGHLGERRVDLAIRVAGRSRRGEHLIPRGRNGALSGRCAVTIEQVSHTPTLGPQCCSGVSSMRRRTFRVFSAQNGP